jgi:hypothetical protein
MPSANNDGPFHLRFWMQTEHRKMGMCYMHLPRTIPELAHRIGLCRKDEKGHRGYFENPPDAIDMKDAKKGAEEWKSFLKRMGTEGDPMAICNMGYSYFNGARSSVGIMFVEKNIDALPGTSTGTEIASFVDDPNAKWHADGAPRALDLFLSGQLEVGDRIVAVDGMDATDDNIYALLTADDIPGSSLTISVQKKADVELHRKDSSHKSQQPIIFKICRLERLAARREYAKQKAIDLWKKAAERGKNISQIRLGYSGSGRLRASISVE